MKVVVIGAGIAGLEVSRILSNFDYKVTLIEKESAIGGKLPGYNLLFPTFRPSFEIINYMDDVIRKSNFHTECNTEINKIQFQNGGILLKSVKGLHYEADAIVLATGYDFFNAERKEEYGYKIYKNVVTSVDLEKIFQSQQGIKTFEGKEPGRIAFIHCVGSRDEKSGNHYCSRVCCVTGVKQAIELKKELPKSEIYCFYMDLRMYGQRFEELYREAQEKYGIQFIRGRLSEAAENIDKSIQVKAEDTLSGRPLKMNVDMLVLLVGMEAGEGTTCLAKECGIKFLDSRFPQTQDVHLKNTNSSKKGVFFAGTSIGPMSVSETIVHARSAAMEVHEFLQTKLN